MKRFAIIITILLLAGVSNAKTIKYTVKRGDTLSKLAKHYYNNWRKWKIIQETNNIRGTRIDIGKVLLIPDVKEFEWKDPCKQIVTERMIQLHKDAATIAKTRDAFIYAIEHASEVIDDVAPVDGFKKLEMCRWALVTAQQETNFQFAIGAAGEIGMYQFKLDTVRVVLNIYRFKDKMPTDKQLVTYLLDPAAATYIYLLHFNYLKSKYGSLRLAWKRYNGAGPYAEMYAERAMVRYREVKRIRWQKKGARK